MNIFKPERSTQMRGSWNVNSYCSPTFFYDWKASMMNQLPSTVHTPRSGGFCSSLYVWEKSKVKLFNWNKWAWTVVFWVGYKHINRFYSWTTQIHQFWTEKPKHFIPFVCSLFFSCRFSVWHLKAVYIFIERCSTSKVFQSEWKNAGELVRFMKDFVGYKNIFQESTESKFNTQ